MAIAVAASAVAVSRLLGDGEPGAPDPGPVHVHGLGVNPADRSLLLATHTGLFRLGPESQRAERIGDRYQDTMGFTVTGPDRFLGSGHPDVRDDLPPLLGLIESRDGGASWRSISLLGKADFHALRTQGRLVVGYDATGGQLLTSRNSGRSWRGAVPPEPLVDVVLDPGSPARLLAAGESRLYSSGDGGSTWRQLDEKTGLLAWPRADRLYLVEDTGRVRVSRDGGRRWQDRGRLGGQPAALLATAGETLFAATHDGAITRSSDGGATWTIRGRP